MSEVIMTGRNMAMTTIETVAEKKIPEKNISADSNAYSEPDVNIYDETTDDMTEGETDIDTEEVLGEEGLVDEAVDDIVEGDIIIEPGMDEGAYMDEGTYVETDYVDGGYIDPGFSEGGFMEPGMETGMETGMAEVKDPFLSSWPSVIGISAAVFVVSIAIGALLAKLKIKKGIDLYED